MKKKLIISAMLALILVLTGCSDPADSGGGAQPSSASYEYAKSGTTYKLTITQNLAKAAYAPAAGDTYVLLIIKGAETKTSKGVVESILDGVFKLKPENSATTFSVKISAGTITQITGNITIVGTGETVSGPDTTTSGTGNGTGNGTGSGTGNGTGNGTGSGSGQDPAALNGTWVRSGEYWQEILKIDEGNYEISGIGDDMKSSLKWKGTYTADGSNITLTATHILCKSGTEFDEVFKAQGLTLDKWYDEAEFKELFPDTDPETFAPQKGTYTISNNGSSLTINYIDGRSHSYTKQ